MSKIFEAGDILEKYVGKKIRVLVDEKKLLMQLSKNQNLFRMITRVLHKGKNGRYYIKFMNTLFYVKAEKYTNEEDNLSHTSFFVHDTVAQVKVNGVWTHEIELEATNEKENN